LASRDPGGRIEICAGRSMGTGWSLRAVSPPAGTAEGVQGALDRVVAQMSQWEPGSNLSRFNRAPPGQWQMLPPEFTAVLKAALAIAAESGGAFDPAMGTLTEMWGFGASPAPIRPPNEAETADALTAKGTIELDAPGLRARRTGTGQLDFSGIAKGFGVDRAAEWLLAHGVRHFLLEVGGELRGEGLKPDGQPWWVDIESPPACPVPPLRVALHRLAAATSGDYRRWLDGEGARYGHTLDPRTGRPATSGVRSVTVLHANCILADAWATALGVMGRDEGITLAGRLGLAVRMITDEGEALSPAMAEMLD
jgi:thiamine biosynthesis lipoprotein